MTDSSVATDIHKTFDVHLDSRTELTLDLVLVSDLATDTGDLLVVPLTNLCIVVDSELIKDLLCRAAADTEDIGKTYLSSLVVR